MALPPCYMDCESGDLLMTSAASCRAKTGLGVIGWQYLKSRRQLRGIMANIFRICRRLANLFHSIQSTIVIKSRLRHKATRSR